MYIEYLNPNTSEREWKNDWCVPMSFFCYTSSSFFCSFIQLTHRFFFWLFFQLITNQKKEWWTSYTSTFFFVSSGNGSHILFSFWAVALVVPISMTHSYTLSCQYYYYYYYPHYPSTLSSHTYPGQQNNSLCWCSSNSLHSSQVFIFFSFFPMKLHGILFALFFLVHFFLCVCVYGVNKIHWNLIWLQL